MLYSVIYVTDTHAIKTALRTDNYSAARQTAEWLHECKSLDTLRISIYYKGREIEHIGQ